MKIDLMSMGPASLAGTVDRTKEATAWQRQLQRAQAAGWFCRSDRLPANEAAPDRPSAQFPLRLAGRSHQVDSGIRLPPASRALVAPTFDTVGRLAAAQAPIATKASSDFPAQGHAPAPVCLASATATPGEAPLPARIDNPPPEAIDATELRPTFPPVALEGESTAMRFHVEEGPQGLQFWLGLDGTRADVAARASGVAAELRRQCGRAGLLLANVTCNGLLVAGAAPASIRSREEP